MQIVLISGKQGAGKTSLQEALLAQWKRFAGKGGVKLNFADTLYEMHDAVLNILHRHLPKRNIVKDGPLLQLLGTEWGRKTIHQEIWVAILRERIKDFASLQDLLFVVGDCRFENEFDGFPEALKVRLTCPEEVRKARCSMWRENTQHPSEVGLDAYEAQGKFDLVIDTSEFNISSAADQVEYLLLQGAGS